MTADGNASGTIVMINGAPTDGNAKLFKAGAHSVFDTSSLKIGAEYDTPDWSPDKAQSEMDQAITKLGKTASRVCTPPTTAPPVAPSPR